MPPGEKGGRNSGHARIFLLRSCFQVEKVGWGFLHVPGEMPPMQNCECGAAGTAVERVDRVYRNVARIPQSIGLQLSPDLRTLLYRLPKVRAQKSDNKVECTAGSGRL